ncbi:hypothetical protein TRVA0_005S02454 [Trichomonascus vanleenenianus]|uniref:uncharacterized protein n=1 Tax=Trichomonascus vanleenenianus TaxID=2268995 RepID=UPI003ECB49E1
MTVSTYMDNTHPTALPSGVDESANAQKIASAWFSGFSKALSEADGNLFASLFTEDGIWRDIVVFTNDYRSIHKPNIEQAANDVLSIAKVTNAELVGTPQVVRPFKDVSFVDLAFQFTTEVGNGRGTAKLAKHQDGFKAFTVFTFLDSFHGIDPATGANRPYGEHNTKKAYADLRKDSLDNVKPSVIIIGAGHNGLQAAAHLKVLGITALVVDKEKKVGDNWRLRYPSLTLHDPVWANHLSYLPFPDTWPTFTPAGKLGDWLEFYADALELNIWTSSQLDTSRTQFNEKEGTWNVTVLRGGKPHDFTVGHVVLATGLGGGYPKMPPPFPDQDKFTRVIAHSSHHKGGSHWKGKTALVVGACTSAHDICMDFYNNGAKATMLQRSPTFVTSVEKGIKAINGNVFCEGGPKPEDADMINESTPKYVAKLFHQQLLPIISELDKDLWEGLTKAGFQLTLGPDKSGFLMLALDKAGGYYHDTGCSSKIISGDIKVKNGEIDHFEADKVVFKDGSTMEPDVVVFATGYTGFKDSVADALSPEYSNKLGKMWGLDDEGELYGCYRYCGIPNCYYIVGALNSARFNTKMVALQIAGQQSGRLSNKRYTIEGQKSGRGWLEL